MSKNQSTRTNTSPEVPSHHVVTIQKFLEDTSLHGLKYTAQKQSSLIEKAFWALTFLAGLSLSIFFIVKIYQSWDANPIITTLETRNEPIENIEFPAVTICPIHQALSKRLDPLININGTFLEACINQSQNKTYLTGAILLSWLDEAQTFPETYSGKSLTEINTFFDTCTKGYMKIIQEVAPNCDDIIHNYTWKGDIGSADKLKHILTPMGSCCTFNFHLQEGQAYKTPYKGKGFGLQLALLSRNNDTTNETFSHDVLIHDYATYPYRSSTPMQVKAGEVLDVAVEPESVVSDEAVQSVSETKRDCKFKEEYQLRLKLLPTYNNCIMDCLSKFQLDMCKCIQVHMAHFLPNETICGLENITCLRQVLNHVSGDLVTLCKCRPPCQEVIYNTDVASRPASFIDTMLPAKFYGIDWQNYSVVNVFFKKSRYIKYKSSLRYEWQDFMAAAGGLLGVGFGFSLLSAVEIVYFFGYKCWRNGIRESNETQSVRKTFAVQLPPEAHLSQFYRHKLWYEMPPQHPFAP